MSEVSMPVEVFCSYAHVDEEWRDKLERHLSVLKQIGRISFWHDRLIIPGTNWAKTIDTHLETASIVLLLVSGGFFASNYCVGIEMQRALARQEEGSVLVIPILVRTVDWHDAPFAHLQILPTNAKPLTTWQDEEMALTDVTIGIRRALEAVPLLAPNAPRATLPAIWNIPYPRNPFFLGRAHELDQMRQRWHVGQATLLFQPQAISGLGGIGKTHMALEYAYRYHQDYQMVLWAHAESAEALVSSYVALASLLRLPEREAKEQDIIVQAVKAWLQTHRGWLLILDNADDLAVLSDFLPPSLGGHLLLTTRAAATGRLAYCLRIETLLPEQGALFLLRRATLLASDRTLEQASQEERELAQQISEELGGLPLALDQAGAYLEETGMDLASYKQIYQQHQADLLLQRGGFVTDHPDPVATTWLLSFQKVEEKNPAASDLLRLCAFLSPDAISEEILTASASLLGPLLAPVAADAFRRNQAIKVLRAYSLVHRDPKEKSLSIHRLVQVVLQNGMNQEVQRVWAKRAVQAISRVFPESEEASTWPLCQRILPHTQVCAELITHWDMTFSEGSKVLHNTGRYLQERGRYTEAEALLQQSLEIRERRRELFPLDVAQSLNDLGRLYWDQGRYQEAEPLFQRALIIREQQLGENHLDVARSLNDFASLCWRQGKYQEAEPLFQRAIAIREKKLGSHHIKVAESLNDLALLYWDQGKYEQAEDLHLRALAIRERERGVNHPETALSFNNLAMLYYKLGKYEQARPLYQQALAIDEQWLGPHHPNVATDLNNLANLYWKQRQYEQAEDLHLRALAIRKQTIGPNHPDVAYSLTGLAFIYHSQEKYEQAEPLFQQALFIREQELGPINPRTGTSLNNLANLYVALGRYEQAEPLLQRALAIHEQSLHSEHPDLQELLKNYLHLLRNMKRETEAIQIEARIRPTSTQ